MDDIVWRIDRSPADRSRRQFARVFTANAVRREECAACGSGPIDFGTPPVEIRWQKGEPERFGDFLWPEFGWGEVFVREPVVQELRRFLEVELLPVAVSGRVENPRSARSGRVTRREIVVALEEYRELRTSARAPILVAESTLLTDDASPCPSCGRLPVRWSPPAPRAPGVAQPAVSFVLGVEYLRRVSLGSNARGEVVEEFERMPAIEGHGVAFSKADVGGAHLWRASQDEMALLCTSAFKDAVEAVHAKNIDFLRVGFLTD